MKPYSCLYAFRMNQEKYNLNWHNYSEHLKEMLHNMMKSDELTDVTLVCDDKMQLKAHKVVLSACSPVFKNIIKDVPAKKSIIYLRGIQHQEMESILEFMYLGVATLYQARMRDFFDVAKNLEIKDVEFDNELPINIKQEIHESIDDSAPKGIDGLKNEEKEYFNDSSKEILEQKVEENCIRDPLVVKENLTCLELQKSHKKYQCNYCQSRFITSNSLAKHIKTMHVKFICSQCSNQFTTQQSLTKHIQTIHEGVKYACSKCNLEFSQQSNLKQHIKSIHEGERYACGQCDQQFTSQQYRILHVQAIHDSVKYACNQCSNQFSSKQTLRQHVKSKHSLLHLIF